MYESKTQFILIKKTIVCFGVIFGEYEIITNHIHTDRNWFCEDFRLNLRLLFNL